MLPEANGDLAVADPVVSTGDEYLSAERCRQLHRLMVRARVMEERMIKMSKSGEAYFWIGGPGEEAFNVCLGRQIKRGRGPDFDYLHLHYRSSAVMLALGMEPVDAVRQMAMTATDPFSRGRNFPGHFCRPEWNVVPVSSVIENQFVIAPGTALVQRRHGGDGVTVVIGGDAGTAEGDFASSLVWSTRPGGELPLLLVVTNNGWGISTPACTQHGEKRIADRGKAFGIPGEVVDGNDPVASWHAVRRAFAYCREKRRPYLLEARVSRLYGHSSSSGALRIKEDPDCLTLFERRLLDAGILEPHALTAAHEAAREEVEAALEQVLHEPKPAPSDKNLHTYAPSTVDVAYPGDYTGLPRSS